MAEEAKEQATEEVVEVVEAGSNKPVMIIAIVNLVVSLGVAGFVFYTFKKESTHPQVADISAKAEDEHGAGEKAGEHGAPAEGGHGAPAGEHGGGGGKGATYARMVQLEGFTVNLLTAGSVTPKFARVQMTVEVAAADTEEELKQKMPQVRNTIIDLINSKKPDDVKDLEGKNHLREQVQRALNSFLLTGKVKGVYFTSFLVSS
jgi:flagellar FliL protein